MARLTSLIHEVIITSQDETGVPHFAPMGISEVSNHFVIKPFKTSTTYQNLKQHRQCTINYTDDVRVFAGALTGQPNWSALPCSRIEGYYLAQALAHTELEIINFDDSSPRACFTGAVICEQTHAPFRGFNRAQSAVIEAAILVSRIGLLPAQKIGDEINYLATAIHKTAGSRELEAWGWLMEKIKQAGIAIDDN